MAVREIVSPPFATLFSDEPTQVADVAVLRASRRAMATTFEVLLPFGVPNAQLAAEAALDHIDELEDQLSVFRAYSEVSRLNATASKQPVEVESRLFDLVEFAADVTRQTQGAFDIATGALTKAWGFYKRQGRVPTPAERSQAMAQTGIRFVALDRDRRTVRYPAARIWRSTSAASAKATRSIAPPSISLRKHDGSTPACSTAACRACARSGTPPGQPSRLASRDQASPGTRIAGSERSISICAGLGTSAATFQHFDYNGRKLGHLLDPRTGWPAEGVEQVTVDRPDSRRGRRFIDGLFRSWR